jgi:hypothetical protein
MRLRTIGALAGVLVLSTACAKASTMPASGSAPAPAAAMPAPPAPALVNPVGRWTVALTAQGQAFDMVMELRAVEGNEFTGAIMSQAFGQIPISKATRTGNSMVIKIAVPTGDEGTINITFEGDTFSGDWSMPGDGSRVSGRRIVQ